MKAGFSPGSASESNSPGNVSHISLESCSKHPFLLLGRFGPPACSGPDRELARKDACFVCHSTGGYRLIAVIMPNAETSGRMLDSFIVPITEVEKRTG